MIRLNINCADAYLPGNHQQNISLIEEKGDKQMRLGDSQHDLMNSGPLVNNK